MIDVWFFSQTEHTVRRVPTLVSDFFFKFPLFIPIVRYNKFKLRKSLRKKKKNFGKGNESVSADLTN